jgi:hypothetical protein
MEINQILIGIFILIFSIPAGYLLRYFTKEEIEIGRPYFAIIWLISLIGGIIFMFILIDNEPYKYTIIFSLFFIAVISFISWFKANHKRWHKFI